MHMISSDAMQTAVTARALAGVRGRLCEMVARPTRSSDHADFEYLHSSYSSYFEFIICPESTEAISSSQLVT